MASYPTFQLLTWLVLQAGEAANPGPQWVLLKHRLRNLTIQTDDL